MSRRTPDESHKIVAAHAGSQGIEDNGVLPLIRLLIGRCSYPELAPGLSLIAKEYGRQADCFTN